MKPFYNFFFLLVLVLSFTNISKSQVSNEGLTITSAANLDGVVISRVAIDGDFEGNIYGITYYYEVTPPAQNENLDAQLDFDYNEVDVVGVSEASLRVFKSFDGITWYYIGGSVDEDNNSVTVSNIDDLSYFAIGVRKPSPGDVVINEIVTDPQQNWNQVGARFTDDRPGGSSGQDDEWVELYIKRNGLDLTGWTIELNDGTDVIGSLVENSAFEESIYLSGLGGSFISSRAGDYLVLGNVDSDDLMNNDIDLILRDPEGNIIDRVEVGAADNDGIAGNEAPDGNANSILNESLIRYPNGVDSDNSASDFIHSSSSLGKSNSKVGSVKINEIVTDPQQDWSTNNFNGIPSNQVVSSVDEWVELYIVDADINLHNWILEFKNDGGELVSGILTEGGAFEESIYFTKNNGNVFFANQGDYLVLGNPTGANALNNNILVTLKDPNGNIIDQVEIGSDLQEDGEGDEAPGGNATNLSDESISRINDGVDSDDDSNDFVKTIATLGKANIYSESTQTLISQATFVNGNTLWLKADDLLGYLNNNDATSYWSSANSASNQVIFNSQGNPEFLENTINGFPTISFDGVDDVFTADGLNLQNIIDAGAYSIVIVSKVNSSDNNANVTESAAMLSSSESGFSINTFDNAGQAEMHLFNNDDNATANSVDGDFNVWTFSHTTAPNQLNLYKDGVLINSAVTENTLANTLGGAFQIGRSSANRYFNGEIAEIIAFRNALNPTERTIVENYLEAKYGGVDNNVFDIQNDKYAQLGDRDYIYGLSGIGKEVASEVTESSSSGGMSIDDLGFLQDAGDYILFAHNNQINEEVYDRLPQGVLSLATARWNKTWYIDKTDINVDEEDNGDNIKIAFNFKESGLNTFGNKDHTYYLLFSANGVDDFEVVEVKGSYLTSENGTVEEAVFDIDSDKILDGYYTLGRSDNGSGNAIAFDGIDDYMSATISNVNSIDAYTISLWFSVTDKEAGGDSPVLITFGNVRPGILLKASGGNDVVFKSANFANPEVLFSYDKIEEGQWYHLALTNEGGAPGTIKCYLNGILESTFENGRNLDPQLLSNTRFIGSKPTSNNQWEGALDEISIWNRDLSELEIRDIMSKKLSGEENNLVAYYQFNGWNEPNHSSDPFKSKNNNSNPVQFFDGFDDANPGDPSNQNDVPPLYVPSGALITGESVTAFTNALELNGVDQYADISDLGIILNADRLFTIEGWIKNDALQNADGTIFSSQGINIGYSNADDFLHFTVADDGANTVDLASKTALKADLDRWNYFAAVIDGAIMQIYINGALEGERITAPGQVSISGNQFFGKKQDNSGFFRGKIDEFRIWTTVRTHDQLQKNVFGSLEPDAAGLFAYYNFDLTSGEELPDATNNLNIGTVEVADGDQPMWVIANERIPKRPVIIKGAFSEGSTWFGQTVPVNSSDLELTQDITLDQDYSTNILAIREGVTLTVNDGVTLTIENNLINEGTITGEGSVVVEGQYIYGGTYDNLNLNTADIEIQNDINITNDLRLLQGDVLLGESDVTVFSRIRRSSSDMKIITNSLSTSEKGFLNRYVPDFESPILFPLGNSSSSYTPLTIINSAQEGFIKAKIVDGLVLGNNVTPAEEAYESVTKTWTIESNDDVDVAITFHWSNLEEFNDPGNPGRNFDIGDVFLTKRSDIEGYREFRGDEIAVASNGNTRTLTVEGITSFSDWGIGSGNSVLPVSWVSFYPVKTKEFVVLHWETATEVNNKGFSLEKSMDGKNYETIRWVDGVGESTTLQKYTATDSSPYTGLNYYRLKQIDHDGKFEYSKVVSIYFDHSISEHNFQIYPNPTSSHLNIISTKSLNGDFTISIHGLSGKEILKINDLNLSSKNQIDISNLNNGIYLLRLYQENEVETFRILKN